MNHAFASDPSIFPHPFSNYTDISFFSLTPPPHHLSSLPSPLSRLAPTSIQLLRPLEGNKVKGRNGSGKGEKKRRMNGVNRRWEVGVNQRGGEGRRIERKGGRRQERQTPLYSRVVLFRISVHGQFYLLYIDYVIFKSIVLLCQIHNCITNFDLTPCIEYKGGYLLYLASSPAVDYYYINSLSIYVLLGAPNKK